jgi:serine/tyrosine/threonine adenylyltransferase
MYCSGLYKMRMADTPAVPYFTKPFNHHFGQLPDTFYTRLSPRADFVAPHLLHVNPAVADVLGLPAERWLSDPDFARYFSGAKPLPGADPLAMVYAGHQFGVWAGQLGDGRAVLLGQVPGTDGHSYDIQLKGAGVTPYSRMGDGRAVLRSSIREYLCSEAMHALGIPTTRALCLVATGEQVQRETWEPGAVITRVAQAHLRFGHIEHFCHTGQHDALQILLDYTIARYDPQLPQGPGQVADWFALVSQRTAALMAHWQAVGFAHGVMNTDNMSLLGLTLDYGPFGFMEGYNPGFVCNHSDHRGRYAFSQQPQIGLWNLHALALALRPVLPEADSQAILAGYAAHYRHTYNNLMAQKLGLTPTDDADQQTVSTLTQDLLTLMAQTQADYTLTFRELAVVAETPTVWYQHIPKSEAVDAWLARYLARRDREPDPKGVADRMNQVNPRFTLRNWVAETVIRAAEDHNDLTLLDTVFTLLQHPYTDAPTWQHLAAMAPPGPMQHLCVSCSS